MLPERRGPLKFAVVTPIRLKAGADRQGQQNMMRAARRIGMLILGSWGWVSAEFAGATSPVWPISHSPAGVELRYAARLDEVSWHVEQSVFGCRLWHPVPDFGRAVFESEAGHAQRFHLEASQDRFVAGRVSLQAEAPHWAPRRVAVTLGGIPTQETARLIRLDAARSQRLLDGLYSGLAPTLRQTAGDSSDPSAMDVVLSPAGFRAAYREYRQCLAHLLPVSFEQIARSHVQFKTSHWELDAAARRQLDLIILYTRADQAVTELLVDGHSDDVGRRLYNVELSRKRAEAVVRYLVRHGIDEERIVTRYHGHRLPAVAGSSEAARSQNRRVTIRLERDDA